MICLSLFSYHELHIPLIKNTTNTRNQGNTTGTKNLKYALEDKGVKNSTIHIATLIIKDSYFRFGLVAIKSIVFTTKRHLNFYVVTNDDSVKWLQLAMEEWPTNVIQRINVFHIPFNASNWEAVLPLYFGTISRKLTAYGSIFNSRIISQHTSKIIYMDADFLALVDISELWDMFHQFKHHQTIATSFGTRYVASSYTKNSDTFLYDNLGINAGLMLMDLGKLKGLSFLDLLHRCSNRVQAVLLPIDDQDLLLLYLQRYPEQHLLLPCSWNFRQSMSKCNEDGKPELRCFGAEKNGIHFLHGTKFSFFTKGQYANIFSCMSNVDFGKMRHTGLCLQKAIKTFKQEEKQCKNKINFLDRLAETVSEY